MGTFMLVAAYISASVHQLGQRRDEKGATAVEYGLLVALIAAVIIAAVTLLGTNLSGLFNKVASTLPAAAAS